MRRSTCWAVAVALGLSGCGSSDGSATATDPATTPARPVTPSVRPTNPAPPVTGERATTTTEVPGGVAFRLSDQHVTPIPLKDPRAMAMVTQSQVSGDLDGTMTSTTMAVQGSSFGFAWFEGTAGTCGTGGLAVRFGDRPDGTAGWEVVQGLGTDDLTFAAGTGTTTSAGFEGALECTATSRAPTLSTTLLAPKPADGRQAGVPIHVQGPSTTYDVVPHAAQTAAPKMWVVEATYDPGFMFQLFAWRSDAAGGVRVDCAPELCNTHMAWWFLDDLCDGLLPHAVSRAIVDDVELPQYSGGWDIPSALNGGVHGGGTFDATSWGNGGLVC